MGYDFDTVINRKNTGSFKHDLYGEEVLPFWVADMDFKTAEPILEAIKNRVDHGVFGYTNMPQSLSDAFCDWQKKRNGYEVNRNLLTYGYGVIPLMNYLINRLTEVGDGVLIQTPVYNHFPISINSWKRRVVSSKLWQDNDGKYFIDYDDFEKKIKDNGLKLFLLCSPQNPIGRIWTPEELTKMCEICIRNNVTIISDEIHSDLILKGKHVVTASLSEEIRRNTITLFSATKTFNLAGLQLAFAEFNNEQLYDGYNSYWDKMDMQPSNPLSLAAVEAAYRGGEEWLSDLLEYLRENADYIKDYISQKMPRIKTFETEATYLLWLDCRGLYLSDKELDEFFTKKAKAALTSGYAFGDGGEGFMRFNFACPRSVIKEGLDRIYKAYQELDFE